MLFYERTDCFAAEKDGSGAGSAGGGDDNSSASAAAPSPPAVPATGGEQNVAAEAGATMTLVESGTAIEGAAEAGRVKQERGDGSVSPEEGATAPIEGQEANAEAASASESMEEGRAPNGEIWI